MGDTDPYEILDFSSLLPLWGKRTFKAKLQELLDEKKYEFSDLLHSSLCDGGAGGPIDTIEGIAVIDDPSDDGDTISAEIHVEVVEESYLNERHVGVLHVRIEKATGRATLHCHEAEPEYPRGEND